VSLLPSKAPKYFLGHIGLRDGEETRVVDSFKDAMIDPRDNRSWLRFALLSLVLLPNIAVSYGQITSCPVPRLPGGGSRGDAQPLPLPSVSVLPPLGDGFSSAEYGQGNGVTIPYTTAAAYGAQYSSGSMVETYQPSRNIPYV